MTKRIITKLLFVIALAGISLQQPQRAYADAAYCCQWMGWPCDLQGCLDACQAAGWPDAKCSQCCVAECQGDPPDPGCPVQ